MPIKHNQLLYRNISTKRDILFSISCSPYSDKATLLLQNKIKNSHWKLVPCFCLSNHRSVRTYRIFLSLGFLLLLFGKGMKNAPHISCNVCSSSLSPKWMNALLLLRLFFAYLHMVSNSPIRLFLCCRKCQRNVYV